MLSSKTKFPQPCEYNWSLNELFLLFFVNRSHCGVREIPAMLYHKGSLDEISCSLEWTRMTSANEYVLTDPNEVIKYALFLTTCMCLGNPLCF